MRLVGQCVSGQALHAVLVRKRGRGRPRLQAVVMQHTRNTNGRPISLKPTEQEMVCWARRQTQDSMDMTECSEARKCTHTLCAAFGTALTTKTLSAGSSTMSVAHLSRNLPLAVVSYTTATRLLKGVARAEDMRPYMGLPHGLPARPCCKLGTCCSCTHKAAADKHTE